VFYLGRFFVIRSFVHRLDYISNLFRCFSIYSLENGLVTEETVSSSLAFDGLSFRDVNRVLSAVSSDGLNWVGEQGVRIDPQDFCLANTGVMAPSDSYIDSNGTIHQYIWTVTCKNQYYKNASAGLFEFTSIDGLTFNIGSAPIISGYFFKDSYEGNPDDPGMRMDNAPVVMTPDGLRAYLYTYCPQPQCADRAEKTGYYSVLIYLFPGGGVFLDDRLDALYTNPLSSTNFCYLSIRSSQERSSHILVITFRYLREDGSYLCAVSKVPFKTFNSVTDTDHMSERLQRGNILTAQLLFTSRDLYFS
jgi:hypothetical protein